VSWSSSRSRWLASWRRSSASAYRSNCSCSWPGWSRRPARRRAIGGQTRAIAPVAEVDPDVADGARVARLAGVEHQVTGSQRGEREVTSGAVLLAGDARQRHPGRPVGGLHQARHHSLPWTAPSGPELWTTMPSATKLWASSTSMSQVSRTRIAAVVDQQRLDLSIQHAATRAPRFIEPRTARDGATVSYACRDIGPQSMRPAPDGPAQRTRAASPASAAAATAAPALADRAQLGGDLLGHPRRRCGEQFGQQDQPGAGLDPDRLQGRVGAAPGGDQGGVAKS
jgi:hypothetical protein